MTLIKPKNKKLWLLTLVTGLALLLVSLTNVFVYNKIVNLQHSIASRGEEIQELRLINTDLKNKLYKVLDVKKLSEALKEGRLVKVKNLEYLQINEPISLHNFNN